MTTLIIGGTGRVGSAALQTLLDMGKTVRCLSHTQSKLDEVPANAEKVFADLDDPASLQEAFQGVEQMLLSLTVNPAETNRGKAAIDAALAAGVKKTVYISFVHTPGSETKLFYKAKREIEAYLRQSGMKVSVMRPANFYQSDDNLKPYIVDQGVYPAPIGNTGVDRIDARDVGYAAAHALASNTYDDQDAELYGEVRHTGESVASAYSEIFGMPVRYLGNDIQKWRDINIARLGDWYVEALSGLYEQQQKVGMRRPDDMPRHPLLPTQMRTMESYIHERKALWLGHSSQNAG